MARSRYIYFGREEFIDVLIADGYMEGTALSYASQIIKDSTAGKSARRKWDELMTLPLPDRYFVRTHHYPAAPEIEKIPFYIVPEEIEVEESEEDIVEEFSEEASSEDNSFVHQIIDDVLEEERKSQVSLLLELMQDIIDLDLDAASRLAVIGVFIYRMEQIEWVK